MNIHLQNTGKKFNRDWIFRNINFTFQQGKTYAVTGPNGSGKSTLLQVLAASMHVSEGECKWMINDIEIQNENIYKYISIAAPYLELTEEMTAVEFLKFHASFKPLIKSFDVNEIIRIVDLKNAADKQIRFYSSGMKQRIKLAQAVFSDVPVLLLDEPCTNFDEAGYELYHHLIKNYCTNKLIIVSSNDVNEYNFCEKKLMITDYK